VSEARDLQPLPGFTSTARAFEDELDYLYRALRRYGVSAVDAEDLAQDVFVVMWRRWADYQSDRPLRPWLAGIAVNLAQKHLRRRGREVPDADLEPEDPAPRPEDHVGTTHARALVLRALARLPEKYRLAIVLHEIDELSMHEIAAMLAIPLATAYTRVRRARLLFAIAVREVERAPAQARSQAAALLPAGLFELERLGAPAPASVRRRALARVRALEQVPARELPAPARAGAPALGRVVPALGTAAFLGLLAALLLPAVSRRAPRVAEPEHAAHAATTFASVASVAAVARPALRMPAPTLAPAPEGGAEAATLHQGLVGYWRFDDGRGSALAHDLSAGGHDCVLHGLDPEKAWVKGAFGGAIRIGAGTWLECPQAPASAPALELSIAAWTRRKKLRTYHTVIAARPIGNERKEYFMLSFAGAELEFRSELAHGTARLAVPEPGGRWVHVAVSVHREGKARLYVDGLPIGDTQLQQRAGGVDGPILIGAARTHGPLVQSFDGDLDELAIYDRALGDDEIAALARGAQPAPAR
jgi:RNA polymerase sigma factor (sigma-70 family)